MGLEDEFLDSLSDVMGKPGAPGPSDDDLGEDYTDPDEEWDVDPFEEDAEFYDDEEEEYIGSIEEVCPGCGCGAGTCDCDDYDSDWDDEEYEDEEEW